MVWKQRKEKIHLANGQEPRYGRSFLVGFSIVVESHIFSMPIDFDIVLTTYETVVADSVRLSRMGFWECVVLDEGHRIKNFITKLSTTMKSLKSRQRVILTG